MSKTTLLKDEWRDRYGRYFREDDEGNIFCLINKRHPRDWHKASLYELEAYIADELAQAKASWVAEVREQIGELVGNGDLYLLPPGAEIVHGYPKHAEYRIVGMCVTKDVLDLPILKKENT